MAVSTDRLIQRPTTPNSRAARIGQIQSCLRSSRLPSESERKHARACRPPQSWPFWLRFWRRPRGPRFPDRRATSRHARPLLLIVTDRGRQEKCRATPRETSSAANGRRDPVVGQAAHGAACRRPIRERCVPHHRPGRHVQAPPQMPPGAVGRGKASKPGVILRPTFGPCRSCRQSPRWPAGHWSRRSRPHRPRPLNNPWRIVASVAWCKPGIAARGAAITPALPRHPPIFSARGWNQPAAVGQRGHQPHDLQRR